MGIKKIMEAINSILKLNKEAIMATLTNKTIPKELFDKGREACEALVDVEVYDFKTDCSDAELLKQIEEFVQNAEE